MHRPGTMAGRTRHTWGTPECPPPSRELTHVRDDDGAYDIVERLWAALAPGSHLVLSQMASDFDPGIAWLPDWHPELGVGEARNGTPVPLYAGVGRKQ
ncbi:SAM-dependent methyltransferase [Streptomyces sp. NPDC086554]|uniref:SAM-dependent methyltransferase n=1 Tax=Streptomyces sp. NPDC086554 TaxID=3154864 RepID=UPI003440C0EA